MMIPGILAQRRQGGVVPVLWTPLNLPTIPPLYIDASDSSVTEVSGGVSLISNLGAMGVSGDFEQVTAGSRPILLLGDIGGRNALRFDGVDDFIGCNTTVAKDLLRNVPTAWSFDVLRKRSVDSAAVGRLVFDCRTGSGGNRFSTLMGQATKANSPGITATRIDGAVAGLVLPDAVPTNYFMRLSYVGYATRFWGSYINGALATFNANAPAAGNTSDTASSSALTIGAHVSGAPASDVNIATILVGRTDLTTPDIDKLFGWAAHKWGLASLLPVGHPYKTSPPTV